MTLRTHAILALSVLLALASCDIAGNLVHDDNVVARAAGERLYRSTLESLIPDGTAPADSARMAQQYIQSWASEAILLKKAQKELSKEARDVSREMEDYRRSLLRYRYEQQYINDRLDTLITDAQIKDYYEAHSETFTLARPIMKVRFISFFKDSPYREEILDLLPANGTGGKRDLDSLVLLSAVRYIDNPDTWTDAALLSREFGTDWETMMSQLKSNYIVMEGDDVRAAYVFQIITKGKAPLEFCAPTIRDNILSARKRSLLEKLEQDLLTEAQDKKDFVIYGDE
ncbi:MAG: hypothetical protein II891_02860 [Bacteroidales bacterium]|nr:hypothetical protein [Bacteroidales bacterium]